MAVERNLDQHRLADAERLKTDAITEAAAILAKAKSDADQLRQDTEGELLKRSEHLKREQNLLKQRKEALVAQLNNLSSLANLTALEFPDDEGHHPVREVLSGAEKDAAVSGPAEKPSEKTAEEPTEKAAEKPAARVPQKVRGGA